ncbi:MAG: hypothetical protein KDC53_12270 [Saprospiraceae bacterium]|nr:hypothetical protein [Saprospiraceae bacterium]
MIQQIKVVDRDIVAIEAIEEFNTTDAYLCENLLQQKMSRGYDHVNLLIKFDHKKISQTQIEIFLKESLKNIRKLNHLGHLALVLRIGSGNCLQVPLGQHFFERSARGWGEQYFDLSQIYSAWEFVSPIDHERTMII